MIRKFIPAALTLIILAQQLYAQQLTPTQVQQIVSNKHYTFEAQTVSPQSGAARQLNTEYFLKIAGDSLISALPYFGRAYTAPFDPAKAAYDFTSTKFDYAASIKKKDHYIVSIKTNDKTSNTDFELTIYNNGNAYLNITNSDRQPISFKGYIK